MEFVISLAIVLLSGIFFQCAQIVVYLKREARVRDDLVVTIRCLSQDVRDIRNMTVRE